MSVLADIPRSKQSYLELWVDREQPERSFSKIRLHPQDLQYSWHRSDDSGSSWQSRIDFWKCSPRESNLWANRNRSRRVQSSCCSTINKPRVSMHYIQPDKMSFDQQRSPRHSAWQLQRKRPPILHPIRWKTNQAVPTVAKNAVATCKGILRWEAGCWWHVWGGSQVDIVS